jgi:hypothetical protein
MDIHKLAAGKALRLARWISAKSAGTAHARVLGTWCAISVGLLDLGLNAVNTRTALQRILKAR